MSKRGQGLPVETIVIAAIAVIILLLVVGFATGALGGLFKRTTTIAQASEADITAAQTKCSQYCVSAQNSRTLGLWSATTYCQKKFNFDFDGDGQAGGYNKTATACVVLSGGVYDKICSDQKEVLHCSDSPISQLCSATSGTATYTEANC